MEFLNDWRIIEKTNLSKEEIHSKLPICVERMHLVKISIMLERECLYPSDFYVYEYPITGVYIIKQHETTNYFTVAYDKEKNTLQPTYTTIPYTNEGINTFPSKTIREAIKKNEC